jgi:transposase
MGLKQTDEFCKDAVRIALTSGLTRKQVADDLIPEIAFARFGLLASKLGKKASKVLGAIHHAAGAEGEEAEIHGERLHQVLKIRGKHAQVKTCLAIEGRIRECKEILSQHKATA